MKFVYLKVMGILLICVLLFQLVDVNLADASEKTENENSELSINKELTPIKEFTSDSDFVVYQLPGDVKDNNVTIQASSNKITLFFKGIVVGALTSGTIIYTTGKAPEEWVVWGLTSIEKKIKAFADSASYVPGKPIYVASNGNISNCVVYPCAIRNSIESSK